MTTHRVVTRRESKYPFKPYWVCICGYRFRAPYMGSPLYKELAQHEEDSK